MSMQYTKYNSIGEAVDAFVDKLVTDGVLDDDSIKSPEVAVTLSGLTKAYLGESASEFDDNLSYSIADQLYELLCVMANAIGD